MNAAGRFAPGLRRRGRGYHRRLRHGSHPFVRCHEPSVATAPSAGLQPSHAFGSGRDSRSPRSGDPRLRLWSCPACSLLAARRRKEGDGDGGSLLHGGAAYIAIAGLLIYTGSFAIGLGPVFWLLISEIYPVTIRGQAMSVATLANWGANFVVTFSFLTLLSAIGNAGIFFLFAGLSVVALAYFQL